MLEKLEIKEWLELNAKLQQKKNNLRKTLKEKGILKKGKRLVLKRKVLILRKLVVLKRKLQVPRKK